MLDNRNVVSNHVNAVSGNITKTYAKSFFSRFNLKSEYAGKILSTEPYITVGQYHTSRRNVQVIQMLICGDMEVIAEIMFKEDYDEMLKNQMEVI